MHLNALQVTYEELIAIITYNYIQLKNVKMFSSNIFVRYMMILHIDIKSIDRKIDNRYTNLRGKIKVSYLQMTSYICKTLLFP